MTSKSLKKLIILVTILAVPGFLYYLLTVKGKNRYKPLPIYGPKQVAKTSHRYHGKDIPDTIYHKLSNFILTDQDGKTVTLSSFNGDIFVASFFYTRCPSACTDINKNMARLATAYEKNKMLHFVSITVDPEHDQPEVLKAYMQQFEPKANWQFLTGDTTQVYSLARNGFLVNALQVSNSEYVYSDKLILIDADRRIRGYYTGASATEINRLNDEIKVMIAEELRKIKAPE